MPKVVLCGYYGQGNAGDEALLLTLLQMLPPSAEPLILSHNPSRTTEEYGVKAVPHKSIETFKTIAAADWFIWGGGSLMQDVSSLASPIYYGALMKFAQFLGKKTMAWGQGIGPLNSAIARYITRNCLQGCQAVSVRDQGSSELLNSWQIKHILAPDPVWALQSLPLTQDLTLPQPRIALNLRTHAILTPEKITLITQALKQLQTELNASIYLLPFQQSQDLAIAEAIYAELREPKIILTIPNPQYFKSLFAQMDFMIGMRLHSLILAASAGCPCFALSYDPKVTQLQKQCDLVGLDLENFPTDRQTITQIWLDAFNNRQGLTPEKQEHIQTQVAAHRQLFTALS